MDPATSHPYWNQTVANLSHDNASVSSPSDSSFHRGQLGFPVRTDSIWQPRIYGVSVRLEIKVTKPTCCYNFRTIVTEALLSAFVCGLVCINGMLRAFR